MINFECRGRSLRRGLEREVWPNFVHDGIVLGTHADDESFEIMTGGCGLERREDKVSNLTFFARGKG